MMERGREGRRGGTGGGCISAPRRARTTGLKDATVGDDGDDAVDDVNARLRERPKKDSGFAGASVQEMPTGSLGATSRHKRKQQGMLELRIQARSFSSVRDPDEVTESLYMGASDEDDGSPPPVPRRLGKIRPQGKYMDEGPTADLPTVPRKARTAILKRPQEYPSSSVGDASQQGYAPVVKSSAAKPNNSKLRTASTSKGLLSGAISEREAEVVEALFDLARMCTYDPTSSGQEISADVSSLPRVEKVAEPEENEESKAMVSLVLPCPLPTSCVTSLFRPVTSSQTLAIALTPAANGDGVSSICDPMTVPPVSAPPAEAPKRKRPRLKTSSDVVHDTRVQLRTSNSEISHSCGLHLYPLRQDVEQIMTTTTPLNAVSGCVKTHDVLRLAHAVSTAVPAAVGLLPSGVSAPDNRNFGSPALLSGSHPIEMNLVGVGAEMQMVKTEVNRESPTSKHHTPWVSKSHESSGFPSPSTMLTCETSSRSSHQTNSAGFEDRTKKLDSDLMVHVPASATGKPFWLDKEERQESARQDDNDIHCEWSWDNEIEGNEGGMEILGEDRTKRGRCQVRPPTVGEAERENVRNNLAMHHQRRGKAQALGTGSPSTDRTAATMATSSGALLLASAPISINGVRTCEANISVTSSGTPQWPIGYYSSAAGGAVWPCAVSLDGTASVNENALPDVQLQQHPYFIHSCRPHARKGCAAHVYIAHFIDIQQRINGHPLIRAAFEGSARIFGSKPYDVSGPRSPLGAVFGSCLGTPFTCPLSDTAGGSDVGGSGSVSKLRNLPGREGSVGETSLVANAQTMDRLCGEPRNQSVHRQEQPSQLSIQSGIGFGFTGSQAESITLDSAATVSTASNVKPGMGSGYRAGPVGVYLNPACTSASSVVAFPGSVNGGVANQTIAQAQYLHAKTVVHQGAFAFPFQASAHFGPTLSDSGGLVSPQQDVQYFANPFFTSHVMHPSAHTQHQVQPPAKTSRGLSSLHTQQQHAAQHDPEQVVRNSSPCTPEDHHQQGVVSPVNQLRHAQKHRPHDWKSHHTSRVAEKQAKSLGNTNSGLESKLTTVPGTVYCKENPNMTVCSASPPASLSVGESSQSQLPQECNRIDALGTKSSEPHQQGQLSSQQSLLLDQPRVASHFYPNSTALSMNLKEREKVSSQAFFTASVAATSRACVVGPGRLGLAPVAPVMAPECHVMLHGVADASCGKQAHYQSEDELPLGQFLQSASQHEQGAGNAVKNKTAVDGNSMSSRSGRAVGEDCNFLAKQLTSSASNLSRLDPADSSIRVQGSQCTFPIPRVSSSGNPTLDLMTPPPAIRFSCPQEHPSGSGLQQLNFLPPGNSKSQPPLPHVKLFSGAGAVVPSVQCRLPYSDKPTGGSTSLSSVRGPPLSLSGQGFPPDVEVLRHGQASEHSQMQPTDRGPMGSSLPSLSGTASPAIVTGIRCKGYQVQVATGKRGPISDIGSQSPPPLLPSNSVHMTAKGSFCGKMSSPLSHNVLSGVANKQSALHNTSHVSPIFGANSVQSLHSESFPTQLHPLPSKLAQTWQHAPPQSNFPQYQQSHHTQQHEVQTKHPVIQQQQTNPVLQSEAFQQPQRSQGPLPSPQYQMSLPLAAQKEAAQPQQQSCPREQQHLKYLQNQQPHHQDEQHSSLQGGIGIVCATATTGSTGLDSATLTLGTGSRGSIHVGEQSMVKTLPSSPELMSKSDATAFGMATAPYARNQDVNYSLPQLQFGSSARSGQQQSSSPRNNSEAKHITVSNSKTGNKLAGQPTISDGNKEGQVHALQGLTSASTLPVQQISHPSICAGKSLGLQLAGNKCDEGSGSHRRLTLVVGPPGSSSSSNLVLDDPIDRSSRSGVQRRDARPLFKDSSLGANAGQSSCLGRPGAVQSLHSTVSSPAAPKLESVSPTSMSTVLQSQNP